MLPLTRKSNKCGYPPPKHYWAQDTIIVATVSAIYGQETTIIPEHGAAFIMSERLNQRDIIQRLTTMQYTRNDKVFERSTYRVRGDVIDVFPADAKEALRIELFDDEFSASLF